MSFVPASTGSDSLSHRTEDFDGKNVVQDVHAVLDAMADFANRPRNCAWKGHTGRRIPIGGDRVVRRLRRVTGDVLLFDLCTLK